MTQREGAIRGVVGTSLCHNNNTPINHVGGDVYVCVCGGGGGGVAK